MTAAPRVRVPNGMMLVEDGEGGYEIVQSEERPVVTIGFKVTHAQYAALIPFFESFHERTVSAAMRWLLTQDEVQAAMRRRIATQTKLRRRPKSNGDE